MEAIARPPRFQNLVPLIERLTLVVGMVAAVPVGFFQGWVWGLGVAIGAALSWLNLRWLKQGVAALAEASAAQAAPAESVKKAKVPLRTYLFAMFRYALMVLAVYVMFEYLKVPVLSMIFGLFALGAATLMACLYEILRPVD